MVASWWAAAFNTTLRPFTLSLRNRSFSAVLWAAIGKDASTNATQIGPSVIGLEDPHVLIPAVPGFSPGGPVAGTPEPASIALLGCAVGLSAALIRRKRS